MLAPQGSAVPHDAHTRVNLRELQQTACRQASPGQDNHSLPAATTAASTEGTSWDDQSQQHHELQSFSEPSTAKRNACRNAVEGLSRQATIAPQPQHLEPSATRPAAAAGAEEPQASLRCFSLNKYFLNKLHMHVIGRAAQPHAGMAPMCAVWSVRGEGGADHMKLLCSCQCVALFHEGGRASP